MAARAAEPPADCCGRTRRLIAERHAARSAEMTAASRPTWTQRRRLVAAWLADRRQFAEHRLPRACPICGYAGMFISLGHPPRWDARCLNRGSRERHRLLPLWIAESGGNKLAGKRILQVNTSRHETYENRAITVAAERHALFSAEDDVRYYDLDFADRLREAGFAVETFRMTPEEEVRYGLLRDQWLNVGTKQPLPPAARDIGRIANGTDAERRE